MYFPSWGIMLIVFFIYKKGEIVQGVRGILLVKTWLQLKPGDFVGESIWESA